MDWKTQRKTQRGKVAALTRSRPTHDPELEAARRDLSEARLADYITETLAAAPSLTQDQRDRLALLLLGGEPDAPAA